MNESRKSHAAVAGLLDARDAQYAEELRRIGNVIGYGNAQAILGRLWDEMLEGEYGVSGRGAMVLDGMTAHEFALRELYEFQEATGCDTAAQFLEVKQPDRSQRMQEAGFTRRDTRLECEECGKRCTPQMLPIHQCVIQPADSEGMRRALEDIAAMTFDPWTNGARAGEIARAALAVGKMDGGEES